MESGGIEISRNGSMAVVAFMGTSISNPERIVVVARQIKAFIDENDPAGVVFDFSRVKFFSSQVLGLLIDIRSKLKLRNCEVAISAIDPRLYRVFKITNLDKIFRFFPDSASAVAAMAADEVK